MANQNGKIVNIDRTQRKGNGRRNNKKSRGILKPEVIGAVIFVIIFIYILINIIFFKNKDLVSIYEVQADNINYDTVFRGIAIRNEKIVNSDYTGNINYYIQNGKRSAKNGVVFSVDEGSSLSSQISSNFGIDQLTEDEVKSIKNIIYGYLDSYSDYRFNEVSEFRQQISDTVYELVNDSSIEYMNSIKTGGTISGLHIQRTDIAGVVSYKTDSLCGITFDKIDAEMYDDEYELTTKNLRSTGLVSSGESIYRIVPDDTWQIAVKLTENMYLSLLEEDKVSVFINDYYLSVAGNLELVQRGSDYFALITLDKYMSMYIDDRFLDIEFEFDEENGFKIPISAIDDRDFYLIPLTLFMDNDEYSGQVLLREDHDEESGELIYTPIYPDTFFSDGTYAYVDMSFLSEGDVLCNTDTEERLRVSLINSIEGVYNVNKGYYQFVRIEKLRSNNEYAIVKKNTENGLRLYDHIALDAAEAVDQKIIY